MNNLCRLSKKDYYEKINNDINSGSSFESILKEIVKEYDFYPSNVLKPSKESCRSLELIMKRDKISYFPIDDWLKICEKCLFQNRNKSEEQDLKDRCLFLAKASIKTKDIVILDGHGRTLYYLITFLSLLAPNKEFNIHIPDIDEYSYRWHQLFFPQDSIFKIKNYLGDIFSISKWPKTSVVYFNFCGIGKSENNLNNYILRNKVNKIFISFCSRKNKYKPRGKLLCRRGNFKTYLVMNN